MWGRMWGECWAHVGTHVGRMSPAAEGMRRKRVKVSSKRPGRKFPGLLIRK